MPACSWQLCKTKFLTVSPQNATLVFTTGQKFTNLVDCIIKALVCQCWWTRFARACAKTLRYLVITMNDFLLCFSSCISQNNHYVVVITMSGCIVGACIREREVKKWSVDVSAPWTAPDIMIIGRRSISAPWTASTYSPLWQMEENQQHVSCNYLKIWHA